jgi:succinoglycan biosynthesis transport protein ExoP
MDESRLFIRRATVPTIHEIEAQAREVFAGENEPLVDVWRYWRTIRRHPRIVVGFTLGAVILMAVRLMGETPIYTAETTVQIQPNAEQGSSTLENLVEIETAAANADQYYKTQCAILQSRNLAGEVVRALNLDREPAFNGQSRNSGWTRWWPGLISREPVAKPAPTLRQLPAEDDFDLSAAPAPAGAVHAYLNMLKVLPVSDTNLVKIAFATPDPNLSAELANAHVAAYERQQNRMRGHQSEEAQRFLSDKLAEIKEQLQKSEAALNAYRRTKGIIPGLISVDGKDAVVLDRLADLNKQLTAAQVARITLESQVQLINRHDYASLPEVMQNVTVQELRKQLNDLYGQSAALSSQFKGSYPPLAKLRAQIGEVEARLNAGINNVVSGIQAQYREAVGKESELQAEMGRQRTETLNLNDAAAQYAILQREVDTNRELYNAVLTRMKDVEVVSGDQHTIVSVINSAEAPTLPTTPRKVRDLTLSLVFGLACGIGLAFLFDFLDNTLKNPEEAENYLRLPSLGVVPDFASVGINESYGSRQLLADRSALPAIPGRELVSAHGSYSSLGEAYRNLRTALLLSRAGAPPKIILISSATSREGKTVTSVNLATMLAQLGPSVLIDADLRRSRCHQVLAIDNLAGLTETLTGSRKWPEVIRPTEIDNLDFLSAGSAPPNPTELLGSPKMAEILAAMGERYSYIVIDSSPVLPVSDALLLASLVDGVVVVVNGVATPRQQVKTACARLEYARGKILGVVLNRIHLQSPDYYYYYHHDYYAAGDSRDTDRG